VWYPLAPSVKLPLHKVQGRRPGSSIGGPSVSTYRISFSSSLDISHLAPLSVLCTLQTRAAAWVRGWVIPPVEVMDVLCCAAAGAAHLQRLLNYLFGPQKSLMRMYGGCMYDTLGTGTVRSLLSSSPSLITKQDSGEHLRSTYIHTYIHYMQKQNTVVSICLEAGASEKGGVRRLTYLWLTETDLHSSYSSLFPQPPPTTPRSHSAQDHDLHACRQQIEIDGSLTNHKQVLPHSLPRYGSA
jgi:hypothetical protein